MPDTPGFLERNRLAYVGSHSFVLLIGVLAITSAVTFFHDPNGLAFQASAHVAGPVFQWLCYVLLAAGGVAVIVGLVFLWLPVEAVGHTLICTGIGMTGVLIAGTSTFGFGLVLGEFVVVFTVVCILFRLWALFTAIRSGWLV